MALLKSLAVLAAYVVVLASAAARKNHDIYLTPTSADTWLASTRNSARSTMRQRSICVLNSTSYGALNLEFYIGP
jgi:hypothetical protein